MDKESLRPKFEAWAESECLELQRREDRFGGTYLGTYKRTSTECAWLGFCGAFEVMERENGNAKEADR